MQFRLLVLHKNKNILKKSTKCKILVDCFMERILHGVDLLDEVAEYFGICQSQSQAINDFVFSMWCNFYDCGLLKRHCLVNWMQKDELWNYFKLLIIEFFRSVNIADIKFRKCLTTN